MEKIQRCVCMYVSRCIDLSRTFAFCLVTYNHSIKPTVNFFQRVACLFKHVYLKTSCHPKQSMSKYTVKKPLAQAIVSSPWKLFVALRIFSENFLCRCILKLEGCHLFKKVDIRIFSTQCSPVYFHFNKPPW